MMLYPFYTVLAVSIALLFTTPVDLVASPTISLPLAPAFSLRDTSNRPYTLGEFKGHTVTLFFFCGCPWCHRCATEWGDFQRGGALPAAAPGHLSITLVVFSAPAEETREFARETGVDMRTTVLLPDPDMRVTNAYHADICPRVFVLDARGRIRYTNNHPDDAPRRAPEMLIVSRALTALRQCASSSNGHP